MEHKDNCIPLQDLAIAGSSDSDEPDMLLGGSPRSAVGLGAEYALTIEPSRGQRGVPCFRWVGRIVRRRSRRTAARQPCSSSACPSHEVEQLAAADGSSEDLQDLTASSSSSSSSRGPGLLRRLLGAVLRPVAAVVKAICCRIQPQGPGHNDTTLVERALNVLTCAPFLAVGLRGLRCRSGPQGRYFAVCFLAVGAVASAYHAAWGRLRSLLRKFDYWTICHATSALRAAAGLSLPLPAAAAVAALVPVKPTLVTGINLGLVELKYLYTALTNAHLLAGWGAHAVTAVAAITCFALEDGAIAMKWPPLFHSAWHCLSAVTVGQTYTLLHHLERAQPAQLLVTPAAAI